jgi:HAD superfamily hydrolase (TIGR01509 family)
VIRALLFDLDGTLVDTNAAHAAAYADAFAARGYDVPFARAVRAIGMGGDKLVPALIGEDAARRDGDAVEEAKGRRFEEIAVEEAFPLLPGAEAVLAVARRRGLRLALCTAAEGRALDLILASARADLRAAFDVVITSSDVEASKPDPDVLEAALEKLGLPPEACALVGDTVYDAETARRAGVPFVGVTTGVWAEEELERAGAAAVFADAAALARDLDRALAAAGRAAGGAAGRAAGPAA